jgi:hypothetical protein
MVYLYHETTITATPSAALTSSSVMELRIYSLPSLKKLATDPIPKLVQLQS